ELLCAEVGPPAGYQLDCVEGVEPLDAPRADVGFVCAGRKGSFGQRAKMYCELLTRVDRRPYAGGRVPVEDLHAAGDEPATLAAIVLRDKEVECGLDSSAKVAPPRMDRHSNDRRAVRQESLGACPPDSHPYLPE